MKHKLIILIFFQIFIYHLFGEDMNSVIYDYYYSKINNREWIQGRSSALQGTNRYNYEISNISDSDISTAWVEGAEGDGVGEYVYIPIFRKETNSSFRYNKKNDIKITFSIFNGFCKSSELFYKNNRIKTAKITIFVIPMTTEQDGYPSFPYEDEENEILLTKVIELKDIIESQTFEEKINIYNSNYQYDTPFVLLKFEIIDVYKGTKYDDTCISEINVYGEYVSDSDSN